MFKSNQSKVLTTSTPSVLYQELVSDERLTTNQKVRANFALCLDMVFIGPNDLALSILGYVPARGDEPSFINAIDKITTAARKHGKWVARLSNNGSQCKEHLKTFDTIALSYDIRAMQNWYTAELEVARSK